MYATNQRVLAGLGRHRRGLRGFGQAIPAGATTQQASQAYSQASGAQIGGALGTFLSNLFSGNKYSGPSVQAGLVNWAQTPQGLAILQRIATTGMGPHWSQPDKYPDPPGITYGGTIAPGSGGLPAGVPPSTMSTQQFAGWLVANIVTGAGTPTVAASAPAAASTGAGITSVLQSLLNKTATPAVPAMTPVPSTGLSTASLLSNPVVLLGGLGVVLLLSQRRR